MNAACNVEKQRLMNAIYQCGFAISDITLFLDTHPKDPDALDITILWQNMKQNSVPLPRPENKGRIIGSGPCHRGHGKGGTTNLCGIMKKDYSIRFVSRNPIRRSRRLSSPSLADRTENSPLPCGICPRDMRCLTGK